MFLSADRRLRRHRARIDRDQQHTTVTARLASICNGKAGRGGGGDGDPWVGEDFMLALQFSCNLVTWWWLRAC